MDYFEIEGGHSLRGDIYTQGAKNEALAVIACVLMTDQPVTIHNVPHILDVIHLIDLLTILGVSVTRLDKNSYRFQASRVDIDYFKTAECASKSAAMRASLLLVGPLLARFQKAYLLQPGGDKIGRRRVDTHLLGLKKLNVSFKQNVQGKYYTLRSKKLIGTYVLLEEPSITGTANLIMAAVLSEGLTTLYNAACEPYIQQLCKLLCAMGAKISGIGSNLLFIEGVTTLKSAEHMILPDMIEVGSFIGLAVMTQSALTIKNAGVPYLGIIPEKFQQLGIKCKISGDDVFVPEQETYEIQSFLDGSILTLYDHPWPGLTPDLLSIMLVVATQAKGAALIHQKMFESRLFFTDKLIDMGAKIILCDPHRAAIIGLERKTPLKAITMTSPDIRAGVALLIAALSAQGTSKIFNISQIDRGYEQIEFRLNSIGAKIRRLKVS